MLQPPMALDLSTPSPPGTAAWAQQRLPSSCSEHVSMCVQESLAWGDTVLVDGSPAGSQAGTVVGRGGTVVVGSSVGGGAGAGSGTVMEARPGREGGDYLAALRDASTSHNQGCARMSRRLCRRLPRRIHATSV